MRKLLIVLIIVLNNSQYVKSSFVNVMLDAINELKTDITSFLSNLSRRLGYTPYTSHLMDTDKGNVNVPIKMHRNRALIRLVPPNTKPVALPVILLAASHGRSLKTHIVYTEDGYILTLHRLRSKRAEVQDNGIVLLHHGLLGSSADWILLGPTKSLPYLLSDAGYDVWLSNARGNYYSRSHLFRSRRSRDYWNFSWQEIGEYDLPATLHYIKKTTNCTQGINYVGHGMGATALLVFLSVKPEYNKFMKVAVLLAPLAIMSHAGGQMADQANFLDKVLPIGEYRVSNRTSLPLSDKCFVTGLEQCTNSLLIFTGTLLQDYSSDPKFIPQLLIHVPAGGSSKTVKHYAQLIKNKKFHEYGNKDKEFKIGDISTPIAILSSSDDLLSAVIDNENLYKAVAKPIGHIIIKNKNVSHTEFVWGFNADKEIFPNVIDLIENGPDINRV